MMKKNVCSLLVGYAGVVAVLGLLAQQFAPDLARTALLAGAVGGGLSAVWGLLGLIGKPHRGWAILTLAVTGFVLLTQVVTHWMPPGEPTPGTRTLALLATVMFVTTIGTLMAVAYSSAPDSKTTDGGSSGRGSNDAPAPPNSDAHEAWKETRRRNLNSRP